MSSFRLIYASLFLTFDLSCDYIFTSVMTTATKSEEVLENNMAR